jgi:hypothetical protein
MFHMKPFFFKKAIFLLFASLFLSGSPTPHPTHISIAEVDFFSNKKEIQVAAKVFTDDFDAAIQKISEKSMYLDTKKENPQADEWIKTYLQANFKIKINQKTVLNLNYVGKEYIDDATWVYFSYPFAAKKIQSLEVTNTLVFDLFDDQKNVVNIRKDRKAVKTDFTTPNNKNIVWKAK